MISIDIELSLIHFFVGFLNDFSFLAGHEIFPSGEEIDDLID